MRERLAKWAGDQMVGSAARWNGVTGAGQGWPRVRLRVGTFRRYRRRCSL